MRRRHKRTRDDADLDITAFMNLMIVLVPILLINMIFAHTAVLDLNFPQSNALDNEQQEELQLQVIILESQLVVSDNKGGIIKKIDNLKEEYDFALLGKVMQELKARVPDKKDITIMAKKETSYQTLVSVMDSVRAFPTVVAGNLVYGELFPEISIADAPEIVTNNDEVAKASASSSSNSSKVES
ncbi:biopolymer transporter ExbD [Oleiphilus sp. HI0071]|uniref:ExbD/TolR family protein n=1 Tax=unclassified Oleiphilus TaxID=2631174 RepID=UPI0007C3121F|nr:MULTISPECIES: biopolymer transporter ExbD [unclassified Oleiphilus]KZY59342.1 biopolymer transporter ExbD [Oleiphilus sp. HI0065]KZY83551.1 biopolymer transporter ExbD [Oleiphilus sp. HI0071]KZY90984.1 biopolymer transporter ExbD [Oleiphilus sp. HI0073]KZZ41777.1 biopolymer transporter ExbD [Oleiphilus sp. HI0118]KZZ52296.1 biopolymer transporter ExbD [Oleiphilus sp. HI0122]KZZ74344.1 biopolymer transporter ExbD [Oleiphilus sp. HI0130]KZZ77657.1 biopolymer transporter ExbD [Oleiphilus sp.